ncbi:MAG TPA: TonB-dependent receptor [Saprospiraceae bacterium]|nr:TonB-dependent receptor [Saprospiraceae bacterium]
MKRLLIGMTIILFSLDVFAQADTLQLTGNEIIVTATKTKRQLSTASVPVTLIPQREITQMNAHRLQDVLGEYTGLNTTSSPLGAGIQLQGLDPDYTLIMVDGLPLIGRLNGVLDLSRLSVANIAQVEVVKGPSSALFGSNALAGVVNIITQKPKNRKQFSASAKYSSFNTMDFSAQAGLRHKAYVGQFSVNYYSTGGYDLASNYQGYNISTDYYGKTVSPHHNYSANTHNDFKISKKIDFILDGRYFKEMETYQFADAHQNLVDGDGSIKDYAITPRLVYRLSPKFKSTLKYTHNQYKTETEELLASKEIYSKSFYHEKYSLVEIQNDYKISKHHEVNLGLGYEKESLKTTRLSEDETFPADNKYIFAQYIYNRNSRANFVLGARYENHQNYQAQFNPRASIRYKLFPKITIRASVGRGFKKPGFKQLFFNYTNSAIGYSVFGAKYIEQGVQQLLQKNEIALDPDTHRPIVYPDFETIKNNHGLLNAESSIGSNLGVQIRSFKKTKIDINLFRNDLKNLIEIVPIALKTNGWRAYSYLNKKRVFTQGGEIDVKYFINKNIKISAGYQYLVAKDKDVLDALEKGQVFAKDLATGVSYKLKKQEYGGLLNRSNHTANLKLFVSNFWKQTSANVRLFYKGRFGFTDYNNNQILDIDQEYIPGYFLINTGIQKPFWNKKVMIQLGVDNLLDFTYATQEYTISSLPGRIFFTSFTYKFN